MKQYLLSIYQPTGDTPPPEVLDKVMHDVRALVQEAKEAGAWVLRDDEVLTTDGPFAEAKEQVGGFMIIRAADLDAALEWARRATQATTLPIEVRPFQGEV